MFEICNLHFRYGAKPVLQAINFSLERGKFFSIIGPNGSGKTTLLNLLTGYLTARSGDIRFQGRPVSSYPPETLAQSFAIINQGLSIKFPFSCLEVVMMGRHPFKPRFSGLRDSDMEAVHEAMCLTDTLEYADTLITEVSGGEFQRVMFARALAQQPQVLFLDEAFSGMDIAHRLRSLKLLRRLVDNTQLTVIAIMHDLNLAYTFSDEVMTLKQGQLQGFDTPHKLMTSRFINSVFNVNIHHVHNKGLIVVP